MSRSDVRAKAQRRSIRVDQIDLFLRDLPAAEELAHRKQFLRPVTKMGRQSPAAAAFIHRNSDAKVGRTTSSAGGRLAADWSGRRTACITQVQPRRYFFRNVPFSNS